MTLVSFIKVAVLHVYHRVKRHVKLLAVIIAGYHAVATAIAVIAISFPNIFKRYDHYSPELVAGIAHYETEFYSRRGNVLYGWLFKNKASKKVALLCHGRSRNKAHEMPYVRDFMKEYNVFVFDFTGHGECPYGPTSIGYHESGDVLGAIDWLAEQGYTEVVVMGHSMGAVAAIKAVAEYGTGPARIKGLITEGAFGNLDDLLRRQNRRFLLPPTVTWPEYRISQRISGYKIADNAPEKFIRNVRCPVLILQADGDTLAPADSAKRLAAGAGGANEVVMFGGLHDVPCDEVSARALRFLHANL